MISLLKYSESFIAKNDEINIIIEIGGKNTLKLKRKIKKKGRRRILLPEINASEKRKKTNNIFLFENLLPFSFIKTSGIINNN